MDIGKENDRDAVIRHIYEIVRRIPPGRVTSYGAVARALGMKGAARFVGRALSLCHGKEVPAHRVVNHAGYLTGRGRFATETEMAGKLIGEGIKVKANRVEDFKKVFWDPSVLSDF